MMNNKSNFCYYLLTFLFSTLLLQGCAWESNRDVECYNPVPVTITMSVMDSQASPMEPKVRAGEHIVDPVEDPTWTPTGINARPEECTVDQLFLYVYNESGTELQKVFFYDGSESDNRLKNSKIASLPKSAVIYDPQNQVGDQFSLELQLLPGTYRFVAIANSYQALAIANANPNELKPNPIDLVENSQVLTSDDLLGDNRKYLPMAGHALIEIPNQSTSNETLIVPLERIHSRVEFYLTTAKRETPDAPLEWTSPRLTTAKVTELTLLNEYNGYSLLPQEGEYTAIGTESPLFGKNYSTNLPVGTTSPIRETARASFHTGANKSDDSTVDMYEKRLLPYEEDSDGKPVIKYIYVPSANYLANKSDALTIKFTATFDGEERKYSIPLHTSINDGVKDYRIRRNSVYRINATLNGPNLDVIDYIVDTWEDQNVDIPW